MLRKLAIENCYSIGDRQVLDLTIARNATDPDGRFATPIEGSGVRIPRVVAIYGANASGKTNLLRSLALLRYLVQQSYDAGPNAVLPLFPFASDLNKGRSTVLEVEFDGGLPFGEPSTRSKRVLYRYSVEIESATNKVIHESLTYYPVGFKRGLFDRRELEISAGADFELAARDPVRGKLRPNASVIPLLAHFNHPFATFLKNGIDRVLTNVTAGDKTEIAPNAATTVYATKPALLRQLNARIRRFDLGIDVVELIQTTAGMEPAFRHRGLDEPIGLMLESHGTTKFYKVFPALAFTLEQGGLVVLDEFDNDIHPLVLPEIVGWFQDPESNPLNAQLVMSCHDASLLHHLVKEEIYFTEKDQAGQTKIYGLSEVKRVRRDENTYANYLAGAYGAVPRVA